MEQHFRCTACGKCCYGWLPLTLNDAIIHAARFPLAFVWTMVPQGTKAFALAKQLGIKLKLRNRKTVALLIVPTSYIPPAFPCPALTINCLCSIHQNKPTRCKTMPFYPYRNEQDQADMLIPRRGWQCDISLAAPIIYQNKKIVDCKDFVQERNELIEQAPIIRTYAEYILKYTPGIIEQLTAIYPSGHIVTSISSFLTAMRKKDAQLAAQQLTVLNEYINKTAVDPQYIDYHQNYLGWSKEMAYLAKP